MKSKVKVLKVKTRHTQDNWTGLDVYVEECKTGKKAIWTPFGVWKMRDRIGTYYVSDSTSQTFTGLKEAKKTAIDMFNREYNR